MIINKSTVLSIEWYRKNKPVIEQLTRAVESIVKEILESERVAYHVIHSRAKDIESYANKIKDPKYTDPINQIQDCAGIRIITYVGSDLEKVRTLIENNFDIDKENSVDKKDILGIDKVGYMSVHYVAKFRDETLYLPEYQQFKDLVFEIQIRTILQHAWAEIEHDNDYKFSGKLPPDLKRRFKVLAAVLELADREFNALAKEIDDYRKKVKAQAKQGNLLIPIDSTSIKSYLDHKFEDLIELGVSNNFMNYKFEVNTIYELEQFGILSLKDLEDIIPNDIVENYKKHIQPSHLKDYNYGGLIRDIMLISNADTYFTHVWKNNWHHIYKDQLDLIRSYTNLMDKYIDNKTIHVS